MYQMLVTPSQLPGENPRSFLFRGMNIRQKLILQGSQEDQFMTKISKRQVKNLNTLSKHG